MTVIGIGQLRGDTRGYVGRVAAGETFQVLRRGRLVAHLESPADGGGVPVTLGDLRTRPAQVFDRVEAGQTIVITYRGEHVAVLRPLADAEAGRPARVLTRSRLG